MEVQLQLYCLGITCMLSDDLLVSLTGVTLIRKVQVANVTDVTSGPTASAYSTIASHHMTMSSSGSAEKTSASAVSSDQLKASQSHLIKAIDKERAEDAHDESV